VIVHEHRGDQGRELIEPVVSLHERGVDEVDLPPVRFERYAGGFERTFCTIRREDDRIRCISYPEFLEAREKEPWLHTALAPLKALLDGLEPADEVRWDRLTRLREAVLQFQTRWEDLVDRAEAETQLANPDPASATLAAGAGLRH